MKHSKFCSYHRKVRHLLEQCYSFGIIFNNKQGAGEISIQDENANINNMPFANHDNRSKGQVMMPSYRQARTESTDERCKK